MLRKGLDKLQQHEDPLLTPNYVEADVQALRACQDGNATEDQQRRTIAFIINKVCGTYDCAARRTERDTNLALGKQRVGQHLVYYLNDAPTETPAAKIAARFIGRSKNND